MYTIKKNYGKCYKELRNTIKTSQRHYSGIMLSALRAWNALKGFFCLMASVEDFVGVLISRSHSLARNWCNLLAV